MVNKSSDKNEIYGFLSKDQCSAIYFIGDLNENDFLKCKWYVNKKSGAINGLLLIYPHPVADTILTIGDASSIEAIFTATAQELPSKFHAHFFPEHEKIFGKYFNCSGNDIYIRMCLKTLMLNYTGNEVIRLGINNHEDILKLLLDYPENFYTKDQLIHGYYYGIYKGSDLISMCGTHILSEEYGICALGNIVTAKNYRNKGYSRRCISAAVQALPETISTVGLNVRADNAPAIKVYSQVGFEEHKRLLITYCELKK